MQTCTAWAPFTASIEHGRDGYSWPASRIRNGKLCASLSIGRSSRRTSDSVLQPLAGGHSAELAAILEEAFSQRDADGWEAYLSGFDVACVRADKMRFGEFANVDPGMEANGFVAQVEAPILGLHRRHGPTVQLSKTGVKMGPSCLLGQHTRQILAELGYGEEQTMGLKTRQVVTGPDETWLTRAPL